MDDSIVLELTHELGKRSISEIQEIKNEWKSDMDSNRIRSKAYDFCCLAADLVIDKKRKKEAQAHEERRN